MRIVFLGSGAFAGPAFEALLDAGHDVVALVTQPDREKGRGRTLAPPAMKLVAEARGIQVLQVRRVREPDAQQVLRSLRPELQVVVAFGQILPRSVIDIAPFGTVNVHASLLPRYRGAAPIQWAIASGETETGVTTMQIDEGLDTGPVLLARKLAIGTQETAAELEPRLAALGAEVLVETVRRLADHSLVPTPQVEDQASLAPILRKADGRIDWQRPAEQTAWRVRGFNPWPGSFCAFDGRLLKVLRAASRPGSSGAGEPGTVITTSPEGVGVRCGDGGELLLHVVQPESRKAMVAAAWAAGVRLRAGMRLT